MDYGHCVNLGVDDASPCDCLLREVFEAEIETRKVTDRLKQIMPMSVVHRLQAGQSMIADQHEEVCVEGEGGRVPSS